MKNGSFFFSFFAERELIWFEHLNAEKRLLLPGAFEQTIIGCGEPVRLRLLGKRQVERIERRESERSDQLPPRPRGGLVLELHHRTGA